MKQQYNRTSFDVETTNSIASTMGNQRPSFITQRQDSICGEGNRKRRRNSNQSVQSNKIERRSNSAKLKRFKQSKLQISQVYIKNPMNANFNYQLNLQSNNITPTKGSTNIDKEKQIGRIQKQMTNRRPLTPHKTNEQLTKRYLDNKKNKKQQSQAQKNMNQMLNQKDIQICIVQQKLKEYQQENKRLKKVIQSKQKIFQNILLERNQYQKRNNQLQSQIKIKTHKLSNLENSLLQNQNSLAQTKTNLQKLKKMIKQNRINQLQRQNKKLQLKIAQLQGHNHKIKQQNLNLNAKIQSLKQQINLNTNKISKLQSNFISKQKSYLIESMKQQYLNREISQLRDKLNVPKQEKQKQLQQTIQNLRVQLFAYQTIVKKQQIKLDCLSRKQEISLQEVRKQKQRQYKHLKERFRKFLVQYQKFRKQYNQLKIQYSILKRGKKRLDEQFSYELTPQKHEKSNSKQYNNY